jgi:hypothetical protein
VDAERNENRLRCEAIEAAWPPIVSQPREGVVPDRAYVGAGGQIKIGQPCRDGQWSTNGRLEWEEGWTLAILRLHAEIERLGLGGNLDKLSEAVNGAEPTSSFDEILIQHNQISLALLVSAREGRDAVLQAIRGIPDGIAWWLAFNYGCWAGLIYPDTIEAGTGRKPIDVETRPRELQFSSDTTPIIARMRDESPEPWGARVEDPDAPWNRLSAVTTHPRVVGKTADSVPQEVETTIAPKIQQSPVIWLTSWKEIANAVGMDHDRAKVKSLNNRLDGPIPKPPKGGRPHVRKDLLLEWWDRMDTYASDQANQREGSRLSVEQQYAYGRAGSVAPEIKGSVKKRRRDRRT